MKLKILFTIISIWLLSGCSEFYKAMLADQKPNKGIPEISSSQIKDRTYLVNDIYENYKNNNNSFKGRLVMKIVVSTDGNVSGAYIDSTDIDNLEFKLDIARLIGRWKFTNVDFKGDPVVVKYDFRFSPGKKEE